MNNPPSILVIDDESSNFDVIEALLGNEGYQLHYASSGQRAISQFDRFQPDIILLDVMMPELNGIEVCRRIKAMTEGQSIPIIMVTALTAKADLASCLAAGADDFISKPLSGLELRARVHSMLRIKHQYDNIQQLFKLQSGTIQLLQSNLQDLRGNISRSFSHEINTPLNGICGALSLLQSSYQELAPETIQSLLQLAQESTQRMEQLTQRFLRYIQLELETGNKENAPMGCLIPIQNLIEEVTLSKAKNTNRAKDLTLNIEEAHLSIDTKDLKLVLDELLDNAFKFSKQGTSVRVVGVSVDHSWRLSITNEGRGMTEEQINKIGAFMQFDRTLYAQQGIGIGLSLVKKIVENYNGSLSIQNVPHDEGINTITFTLTVPNFMESSFGDNPLISLLG